jgi:mRNA-degrading endonuclease RelE of RelBE toxin-antitoxin system
MSNAIYVSEHVKDSILGPGFSEDQRQKAVQLIDSLRDGDLEKSRIVFPDKSRAGGLRAINADDVRVLFRYDPEQQTVIVADVLPLAKEQTAQERAATV